MDATSRKTGEDRQTPINRLFLDALARAVAFGISQPADHNYWYVSCS